MTISYTYGYIDARTRAIDLLHEAQSDIAEGATVKDRLQELSYNLLDIKPNIGAAIAAGHLDDCFYRDRLLPDNENFRQGYVAGYSDAYGDVSGLKAKLEELRGVPGRNCGWQPIDTAPKDGTKIDLWVRIRPSKMEEPESYERFPASWWDEDRDDWKLGRLCWHSKFYADAHIPTHWMPLPTAPEASV